MQELAIQRSLEGVGFFCICHLRVCSNLGRLSFSHVKQLDVPIIMTRKKYAVI